MTQIAAPATVGAITADTSRIAGKGNLAKAGAQFEAVFTGMMLKSMRAAQLADPLFDSKAIDTFRDMQDQLTVKAMAEHTPLGIGKAMTDFLARGLADAGSAELNQGGTGPLPHPASHSEYAVGGRVGERAGAASARADQTNGPQPDLNVPEPSAGP